MLLHFSTNYITYLGIFIEIAQVPAKGCQNYKHLF